MKVKAKSSASNQDCSSLGSSIIILPEIRDDISLHPSDCELLIGSHSDDNSEAMESEEGSDIVKVCREECVETASHSSYGGQPSTELMEYDDERIQTEVWVASNKPYFETRRRVHSEPTPGIPTSLDPYLDRCSSVTYDEETSVSVEEWCGVSSVAPPPPSPSGEVLREYGMYTDSLLNEIFGKIVDNISSYNDHCDDLKTGVRQLKSSYKKLLGRVITLECINETRDDETHQEKLSNRILIINVPTRLNVDTLKQIMMELAWRVDVPLYYQDIDDAYYVFKKPSATSPVVVIFEKRALWARRDILARKLELQHIPMRKLGYTGRGVNNRICVDEQLIGQRNRVKQAARRAVKKRLLKDSWVDDGHVYVLDKTNTRHVVGSERALATILEQ